MEVTSRNETAHQQRTIEMRHSPLSSLSTRGNPGPAEYHGIRRDHSNHEVEKQRPHRLLKCLS